MKSFDAIFFDLDGTLWDTTATCAIAWNRAIDELAPHHKRLTGSEIASIAGLMRVEYLPKLLPALDSELRERVATRGQALEDETIRKHGALIYPNVLSGLQELATHMPLVLVSNCDPHYAKVFFDISGARPLFRDFETHGGTGLTKSQNVALLMERNGFRQPLIVGDTVVDEQAALDNGLEFLHVTYGFGRAHRSWPTASSFQEVLALLRARARNRAPMANAAAGKAT